jgi:hypothetical protein
MLNRIITGDESWVHQYQPKSKHASVQWKHSSSPPRSSKKFKVMNTPSAGKVMHTILGFSMGTVSHFQKRSENMNSTLYCEVQLKLLDAIHRKRPGQLARGLLLHLTVPDLNTA